MTIRGAVKNVNYIARDIVDRSKVFDFDVGVILGSGLNGLEEKISNKEEIPYEHVKYMLSVDDGIEGHDYKFVTGSIGDKSVIIMTGRFHAYEGLNMQQVALPSLIFGELGVESMLVTNAAGAVNKDYEPGDLMIITDHINMLGDNPLSGYTTGTEGFIDMTNTYKKEYIRMASEKISKVGLKPREGVYLANKGPMYETPAEVRAARSLGADAVGMSTVPEAIMANYKGLNVLGISCITNMAAGVGSSLDHDEVTDVGSSISNDFIKASKSIIQEM